MPEVITNCDTCFIEFIAKNANTFNCNKCKKPTNKCVHGTTKGRCKIDGCYGNQICEHKQHYLKCSICNKELYEINKLNSHIRNMMKGVNIKNSTKDNIIKYTSIENLEELKKHLLKSLGNNNIKDYQLDHIKPKSAFNLKCTEEFMECCHYSNLQFIYRKDNIIKGKKWTEEDEKNYKKPVIKILEDNN